MTEQTPDGPGDVFDRTRVRYELAVAVMSGEEMTDRTHAELEDRVTELGREFMRCLLQDHLDLRAARERRLPAVVGSDGVPRGTVEHGHRKQLATVFGQVDVERIAYRSRRAGNLHPADAALNLPVGKHSHGLRRLAALEGVRGSFTAAQTAIHRATGQRLGKRQLEEQVQLAAADTEDFYARRRPGPSPDGDVLVLSVDGKGIVMHPDALRDRTRKAADAKGGNRLATRLSSGEKLGRKRMATIGAVYDATPAPRTPDDIITGPARQRADRRPGPTARDKWLTADVATSSAHVIGAVFDEATRRDPGQARTWLMLVDGSRQQLDQIHAEARRRQATVHIVLDFVHVLEYLWKAAWCFHRAGDPAAERWVAEQAHQILRGRSSIVAGAMRRKATYAQLTGRQRQAADVCARYLLAKTRYLAYDKALTAGWPIATGIIEGACRHLVKDRMDITGARWRLAGAQAVLALRALVSNGDFDAYWQHHLRREHQRVHQARYRDRDRFALAA